MECSTVAMMIGTLQISRTQYENKGSEPMRVVTNDAITVKTGEASGTITASVYPARATKRNIYC